MPLGHDVRPAWLHQAMDRWHRFLPRTCLRPGLRHETLSLAAVLGQVRIGRDERPP